jgi:hypothetical protein
MPITIKVTNMNNPIRSGVDVGSRKLFITPPPLDDGGEPILGAIKLLLERDNIYIYMKNILLYFSKRNKDNKLNCI